MKQLFSIDLKDYNADDNVFRRPSARAIIIKDNLIALVYSVKEKYYKFPGGGIKDGEDKIAAFTSQIIKPNVTLPAYMPEGCTHLKVK